MPDRWTALLPVTLTAAEKHCIQMVEQIGLLVAGAPFSTIDPDTFADLEERELPSARRQDGVLVYENTETGRLWLRGCQQNLKAPLADLDAVLWREIKKAPGGLSAAALSQAVVTKIISDYTMPEATLHSLAETALRDMVLVLVGEDEAA